MNKLTHIDASGTARMVDVGDKPDTAREARAEAWVRMSEHTLSLIETGGHKKGDVIAVARIAGIQAAKQCASLIPMCHPLMLSGIDVDITLDKPGSRVHIITACRLKGATGGEMEALTAASVAALNTVRHVQGRRSWHGHRGCPAAAQVRRPQRRVESRAGLTDYSRLSPTSATRLTISLSQLLSWAPFR